MTGTPDITVNNITGAAVTASSGNITGALNVGGVLTYADVTNVDSVGMVTARKGLQVLADGANITGIATVSSDVSIADKIIHTGDTTTAIRFPANNTVTVDTNGVERLRVDSTTGRLLLNTDSTIASEPGEGHNPILQVLTYQEMFLILELASVVSQASNPNSVPIILQKSRNSTIGSHTIVQDDDAIGRIEFAGSDGTNFITAAAIIADVDGTPGTNDRYALSLAQ